MKKDKKIKILKVYQMQKLLGGFADCDCDDDDCPALRSDYRVSPGG